MAVQLMLTSDAVRKLLQVGYNQTFTQFSVSDAKQVYDVTAAVDLTTTFPGGERKTVTVAPTCKNSNDKGLTKETPTEKELSDSTLKLKWEISNSECDVAFTGSNIKMTVNLRTYFNYLLDKVGTDNYDYNNKSTLTLIDSIVGKQQQFEPSTYDYVDVDTVSGLDIKYSFDSEASARNYVKSNAYIMTNQSGKKIQVDNTKEKFWSPLIIAATTLDNQKGSGSVWELGLTPISYGYAGILKDSREKTFRRSDFYTITQIETMSVDEINNKFRTIVPAAITDYRNADSSLYVFNDFTGTYAGGVDNLQTMAYRYVSADGSGKTLLEGLVDKAVNNIQATYTESSGVYSRKIKYSVNNTSVNGYTYKSSQIDGGNIDLILTWDSAGSSTSWSDIITYE